MKNNIKNEFIALNEIMKNISILWVDMTNEEKEECIKLFFGIRNKVLMQLFIEEYIPVSH